MALEIDQIRRSEAMDMFVSLLLLLGSFILIWGGVRRVGLRKGIQYLLAWAVIAVFLAVAYQVAGPTLGF